MSVTSKNISLFVSWLTELTAYSDRIVVFPLSFTFSSLVTQFLTLSQPLRKSSAMLASHTQLFIQLEIVTVGHNEQCVRQKKTNHTYDLSLHHTHFQRTQSSVCNFNPLPDQVFSGYAAHTNTTLKCMASKSALLCQLSLIHSLSLTAG